MNSIETYKFFADFYDLYVGKFNSDFEFYTSNCKKNDTITEIGCGTGRILNHLLKVGYLVTGVDISQEMLNKAEIKLKKWIDSGNLSLINHDFSKNKLNSYFDKALLTFYTFNYILDNPVRFIRNIYKCLTDKGVLLMDLFYPNSLFDNSIDDKWIDKEFNYNGQSIKIRDNRKMAMDIEHRQQIFLIDKIETKIDTKRKYYSPKILKNILKKAGFKTVAFSHNYDIYSFTEMIDEIQLKNNYIVKAIK